VLNCIGVSERRKENKDAKEEKEKEGSRDCALEATGLQGLAPSIHARA